MKIFLRPILSLFLLKALYILSWFLRDTLKTRYIEELKYVLWCASISFRVLLEASVSSFSNLCCTPIDFNSEGLFVYKCIYMIQIRHVERYCLLEFAFSMCLFMIVFNDGCGGSSCKNRRWYPQQCRGLVHNAHVIMAYSCKCLNFHVSYLSKK